MARVQRLPGAGRLFVSTDLQGNYGDFERVVAIFEGRMRSHGDAYLVVTGDLVHGPELAPEDWPDYLGTYYEGNSRAVLEHAHTLGMAYPDRTCFLVGNHEHAHIGGPVVSKFFPDEAQRLEELLGRERSEVMRAWISTWPLLAVAPSARILMMHAAPHAPIRSLDDIERLELDPARAPARARPELGPVFGSAGGLGLLGLLLWARTATGVRARQFMRAIEPESRVVVFGHDVARGGFAIAHEPMLCLSTSFGCFDGDKLYLEWDLSVAAQGARDVAARGLRPLHPEAPPVFRLPV